MYKAFIRRAALALGRRRLPSTEAAVRQVEIEGQKLLVLANEEVGRQIFFGRDYEPADTALLLNEIRTGDLCIDAGANTGYYTVLMADRARHGTVHAFEPGLLNWHLLAASVELNRYQHVTVNRAALGDSTGPVDFIEAVDGAYSSLRDTGRHREVVTRRVGMQTLDGYVSRLQLPRVDVIKADVEGAEGLLVEGARSVLTSRDHRPRMVMLELYDPNLEIFDASISEVVRRMGDFGYKPWITDANGALSVFGPQHHNKNYNVFFFPAGSRQ